MTYEHAMLLIAWMQQSPKIVRDDLHDLLAEIQHWMIVCLINDEVRPRFVRRMSAAWSEVDEWRREVQRKNAEMG